MIGPTNATIALIGECSMFDVQHVYNDCWHAWNTNKLGSASGISCITVGARGLGLTSLLGLTVYFTNMSLDLALPDVILFNVIPGMLVENPT